MIKEDLLQFLWNSKKFNLKELRSTEGHSLQIIDFGYLNEHAGPDFFNARVYINQVLWAGNIEIHVFSSDWLKHDHSTDSAYENVILHVVLKEDIPIYDVQGNRIPCLELKDRIEKKDVSRYQLMRSKERSIPCEAFLEKVPEIIKIQAIEKAAIERLEKKSAYIYKLLKDSNNNWEQCFLILMFHYFGSPVNGESFEVLARSIPPLVMLKERNDRIILESLLLGQANLLSADFQDNYPAMLLKQYEFLSNKYDLKAISPGSMKFLRMRPISFPTIRIALLASLLYNQASFFDLIRDESSIRELEKIFSAKASEYWNDHYTFDKKTKYSPKKISPAFRNHLFINVLAPFLHCYGNIKNDLSLRSRGLWILEQVKSEKNAIINTWKNLGFDSKSALESQGLIELKKNFCMRKKCLSCPVGSYIMSEK